MGRDMKHGWRGLSLDRLLHGSLIKQRCNVQQLRDSLALDPCTFQPIELEVGIEELTTQIYGPTKFGRSAEVVASKLKVRICDDERRRRITDYAEVEA